MRRFAVALAFLAGFLPALAAAQAPPPVAALPDTERRTSYSLSGTTCACSVGFQLYGTGTDVDQWIEVWLAGVRYLSTDVSHGWALTSATGSLSTIARPITNAVLTFTAVQTGTVQIVGAERPRRLSQFAENRGVAARDLNLSLTDLVAQLREVWDKTNDVTGRSVLALPGETLTQLPAVASRASKFFVFDSSGNPSVTSVTPGLGNVIGPGSSTVGNFALWNAPNGTVLSDGGPSTVISNAAANKVWAGPTSGSAAQPSFRNLVTADITPALYDPTTGFVTLTQCMDHHYGVGAWTHRTGIGTGSDIGPALNDCLGAFKTSSVQGGELFVNPTGCWLYTTPITATNIAGISIKGVNSQDSCIVFNNSNAVAYAFNGTGSYTGGGVSGVGTYLESGLGNTTSYGVEFLASSTLSADTTRFSDAVFSVLTGTDYWYQCFHADGTARTSPQGIRVGYVDGLQCFNNRNLAIYLDGVVQWTLSNVGSYTGSGTGNDIYITGGGASNTNSVQVTASGLTSSGDLYINNARNVDVRATVSGTLHLDSTVTQLSGQIAAPTVSGTAGIDSQYCVNSTCYYAGHTSGVGKLAPPAVISTPTWALPTSSGTIAVSASAPLSLDATTGALSCAGCGGSTAALTKTDDTNVTLTLGGSPSTALVNAASITAGWTGTLGVTRGGTGAGTFTAHGIMLGQGTSALVPTAVMTDGQLLTGQTGADPLPKTMSGDCTFAASGAITCTKVNSVTYPSSFTSGGIPYASASGAISSSAALGAGLIVQGGGAGTAPSTFTLGGDCIFSTPNITCTKTSGTSFGPAATALAGQYPGVTGATDATAGNIGEYIESVVTAGSPVSLTTATAANVTSISLTAGDWDVDGVCNFSGGATTIYTSEACGVSQTSATFDLTNGRTLAVSINSAALNNNFSLGIKTGVAVPPLRFKLAGTTTIYMPAYSDFSTSTANVFGILRARRVH